MPEPVILVDYDPSWPARFRSLRDRIAPVLADLAVAVEHVGSTSVEGLAAKPIIDIDVAVASRACVPAAIARLATLGYVHQGDLGIPGREAFHPPADLPPHHLYLVAADNEEFGRHLRFRDHLRTHPEDARAYAELKKSLAACFRDDRDAYARAKGPFVTRILECAATAGQGG